ncbi:MAG: GxxExxY protein [Akkermansiaceae bacterium]
MALLYENETYPLVGAFYDVYNELGSGFLEAVYQEALCMELQERKIPFVQQPKLEIIYKGKQLKQSYQPDIVAHSKIIIELKAVSAIDDSHRSQLHNYLKATSFKLGYLVNFGDPKQLSYERIIRDKNP